MIIFWIQTHYKDQVMISTLKALKDEKYDDKKIHTQYKSSQVKNPVGISKFTTMSFTTKIPLESTWKKKRKTRNPNANVNHLIFPEPKTENID